MRKFILGDCMDKETGLPSYPDNFFDLAIVDPPYGLNEKISNGGTWAAKYKKDDGILGGKPTSEYFKELFRVSKNQIIWGGNYFDLPPTRCFVIWDKKAYMDTLADCEYAWTSFDRNAKIAKHTRNTHEKRVHICQKPIPIYHWLLRQFAKPGQIILDTHVGSGSSLIACENMGFEYVGFEIDPDYYEAAKNRMSKGIQQVIF